MISYGDITPITPIGRTITCLCSLFGAATVGMLVSVLVDRYQRVYARKLFIKEEPIDFHDYSDDENNDTDSKDIRTSSRRRISSKIEDPDARAKENAINQVKLNEISQQPDSPIVIEENPVKENGNRMHFIIGYVDNENEETSRILVERINSLIQEKQANGDNVSLNFISNNINQNISPYDVRFQLESSDEDEDHHEELTEITSNCKSGGSVLKTFCRSSPIESTERLSNPEITV